MSEKRLIERWKNRKQPELIELTCYICNFNDKIECFNKYISNDIFKAGELIRHQCPNCDVIFGDLRFLTMSRDEISNDYMDVYSYYEEGETSNYILSVLNKINLGKDKTYLDYACGKKSKTLELLNKSGFNVYGFDAYVDMCHPKFIKNINNDTTFDIVYSNNYIEHLIDPFNDLNKLLNLLKPDGKLVMISSCWEYCCEYTHYHTFFFIGRSVDYLCKKLNIKETFSEKIFFNDGEFTTVKIFEKNTDNKNYNIKDSIALVNLHSGINKFMHEKDKIPRIDLNNIETSDAVGIGDLLFNIICIKNNLKQQYTINLCCFNDDNNRLIFIMKLILDLIKGNNIDNNKIKFIFNNEIVINPNLPYHLINNFRLNIDLNENSINQNQNDSEYIIFHTKFRHHDGNLNINLIKYKIMNFCRFFKSKYKIYIMGEQIMPETNETKIHNISTIYNELLELNKNNNIVNLTKQDIYNNLDYDDYLRDVKIIQNAKINICFGLGGQLCTSMAFGNSTISYFKNEFFDSNSLKNNSNYNFYNIEDMFEMINDKCSLYREKEVYFAWLYHSGLGDNITSIGIVKFLLTKYKTVYFLCRDYLKENVDLIFNNKSVITVPFNINDEKNEYKRILLNIDENIDIVVSGSSEIASRITHPELINYIKNEKYNVRYEHITSLYRDIGLDLSIYIDYFDIDSSKISKLYYSFIKKYKIVFLHTRGSDRYINLSHIVDIYKNNKEYIIICANENVYDIDHPKYELANLYVNISIQYYIDIIKNSSIIHTIDSCFCCIVYPLVLSKKIYLSDCFIYDVIGNPLHSIYK